MPGFIDMHVHGGGGADASNGSAGVPRILDAHHRHGTSHSVLSLVSAPVTATLSRLQDLALLCADNERLLGVHLEGPFISPQAHGAHDPAALTTPTPRAVEQIIAAADGHLAQITMAPELPGAMDAIQRFVAAGVRVAIGHTTADHRTAAQAFDYGASILTHTFNAMPPLLQRAPRPIAAAVDRSHVVLEVVADGHHVDPAMLRALFRLAPARVALVTDATAAAAAGDGAYRLGALEVRVTDGVARLPEGTLAGSTLTLDAAIRIAARSGVPYAEAVQAATRTPARSLGRPDLGTLDAGVSAHLLLVDESLNVLRFA